MLIEKSGSEHYRNNFEIQVRVICSFHCVGPIRSWMHLVASHHYSRVPLLIAAVLCIWWGRGRCFCPLHFSGHRGMTGTPGLCICCWTSQCGDLCNLRHQEFSVPSTQSLKLLAPAENRHRWLLFAKNRQNEEKSVFIVCGTSRRHQLFSLQPPLAQSTPWPPMEQFSDAPTPQCVTVHVYFRLCFSSSIRFHF